MKRVLVICLATLAAVVLFPAGANAATRPGWSELRHQFDYRRGPIAVTEVGSKTMPGAVVHDINYRAAGQAPVSAFLVTPSNAGPHPAAVFLHWLDEAPDANRSEFLDEAVALAAGRAHVVSLLPQLTFPFALGPVGDVRDRDNIVEQVVQIRRGLDLLDSRSDVDPARIAVVGHDYGAMYATLVAAVDRNRVRSAVVMAADATWANWFVLYSLDLKPEQVQSYTDLLATLDPLTFVAHAPGNLLLQYATGDLFIPVPVAGEMDAVAPPSATFATYPVGHSLRTPPARHQRDRFLIRTLR